MPHLKDPKPREPLWKEWDYNAQKKGVRHTVYSVNGDEYTGEWRDNKKDGEIMCNLKGNPFTGILPPKVISVRGHED